MQNYWWVLAISLSLMMTAYVSLNQFIRVKGSLLMIYRGLGTALIMLPFIPLFAPIYNWGFYGLCLMQGLVISYGDNRILNSAKTFGAEVTSLIHPLSIAFIFLFWIVLHPSELNVFLNHPLHFGAIILCLAGVTVAMILICKARANRKALLFLAGGMLCEIFIDITNKETTHLGAENIVSAIFYYTLLTSLVAGTCNLCFYLKGGRKLKEIVAVKNLRYSWFFMLFAIVFAGIKTYAMYLTPNPAYVAAIVHCYPVWIMLGNNVYFKLHKIGNYARVNPKFLSLLLISIIGLIFIVE